MTRSHTTFKMSNSWVWFAVLKYTSEWTTAHHQSMISDKWIWCPRTVAFFGSGLSVNGSQIASKNFFFLYNISTDLWHSVVVRLKYPLVFIPKSYDVRVALLFPGDSPLLTPRFGYSTSAGAISLALERIKRENILPGAKWRYLKKFWSRMYCMYFSEIIVCSFIVKNTGCVENVAAGVAVELLAEKSIDVVIGPPCFVSK